MKINYQDLQKKINFKFKNLDLLIKSLTHKSFDSKNNNEKLEFLGDRVLGLVIAKKLLEIYPDEKEGILDKKFASLVNKKTCLEIAKKINLEKYILTFNPNNKYINAAEADAEGENSIFDVDILSNGFKMRNTNAGLNGSGNSYIYMAFAENPFVTSTGIPTTAR